LRFASKGETKWELEKVRGRDREWLGERLRDRAIEGESHREKKKKKKKKERHFPLPGPPLIGHSRSSYRIKF
jgi:nitrate reductase cytochrome c-type subunit